MGTRCRWTRVLRRNCGRKTQNEFFIAGVRRGVRRGRNCVENSKAQNRFDFAFEDLSADQLCWFCVWGPLSGPENSVDPTQNIRRTFGVRTCGPAYKYRRTCGPTSINFYLSARISVLSYCMSDCCTAFFQVLNFYLNENCTFFTAKSYQTEL